MKAFTTDEVSFEVTECDIPDRLAATGPEFYKDISSVYEAAGISEWRPLDDVHYIGVIEGYIAGYNIGFIHADEGIPDNINRTIVSLDDEEYPAHRKITRFADGTLMLEARFGRNKKCMLAINRYNDAAARAKIDEWTAFKLLEEM